VGFASELVGAEGLDLEDEWAPMFFNSEVFYDPAVAEQIRTLQNYVGLIRGDRFFGDLTAGEQYIIRNLNDRASELNDVEREKVDQRMEAVASLDGDETHLSVKELAFYMRGVDTNQDGILGNNESRDGSSYPSEYGSSVA